MIRWFTEPANKEFACWKADLKEQSTVLHATMLIIDTVIPIRRSNENLC
jgi:hypothetical protein